MDAASGAMESHSNFSLVSEIPTAAVKYAPFGDVFGHVETLHYSGGFLRSYCFRMFDL
jgi:hypothetical protein